MGEIKALESLEGSISAESLLSGTLSCEGGLIGYLSTITAPDIYTGDYNITPQAYDAQTLPTSNKLLNGDIIVSAIPYFETSNDSNGITAYIAKEV